MVALAAEGNFGTHTRGLKVKQDGLGTVVINHNTSLASAKI